MLRGCWILLLAGCASSRPGGSGAPASNPAEKAFLNSRIAKEKGCVNCHTIGTEGGTVGPNLNQVANRRSPEWLRTWLKDPNAVKSGTKMPNFEFSEAELAELLAFMKDLRREVDGPAITAQVTDPAEAGRRLFEAYDCYACHRIGKEGRFVGPDLTWVGKRKNREWESVWLRDPPAYKPDTFMPNLHLSEGEIEALTAYLHTLQGQRNDEARQWEAFVGLILSYGPRQNGELVFKRLACWSCHGEEGKGGVRNSNAVPDGMVPPLKGATARLGVEKARRIVLEGSSPEKLDSSGEEPPFDCPSWKEALSAEEADNLMVYLETLSPKKSKWRFR